MLSSVKKEIVEKICFEITETSAITNIAAASQFVDKVHQLGVKIALDDFGSGASSFGYLKNLHTDFIKIDGQFVRDIVGDPLDDAAVRCFIDAAKIVKAKTIAEFVETKEIMERLKSLGVDYVQGYLIHKPESLKECVLKHNK